MASMRLRWLSWLLACFVVPVHSIVRIDGVEPPAAADEWIPVSLLDICEEAEFFGVVLYEGRFTVQGGEVNRFRVIERLIGERDVERYELRAQDMVYGIGFTKRLVKDEQFLLSFGIGDSAFVSSFRPVEELRHFRWAVKRWRNVARGSRETRYERIFAWLIELLREPALRKDAVLELHGKIYEEPSPASVAILQAMLPNVSNEVWSEIASELSEQGSFAAGKTWYLWYLSKPQSALAWLKRRELSQEVFGQRPIFRSRVQYFWSEVSEAFDAEVGEQLDDSVYSLYFAYYPRRREPNSEEIAAAQREFQRALQALPNLK